MASPAPLEGMLASLGQGWKDIIEGFVWSGGLHADAMQPRHTQGARQLREDTVTEQRNTSPRSTASSQPTGAVANRRSPQRSHELDSQSYAIKIRCEGCGTRLGVPACSPHRKKVHCRGCGTCTSLSENCSTFHNLTRTSSTFNMFPAFRGLPSTPEGPPRLRVVGPTSICLRATFSSQGFVHNDARKGWTLAWGCSLPYDEVKQFLPHQRHNHMPGWDKLNRKDVLAEMATLSKARNCGIALNVPETFVLPQQVASLAKDVAENGGPYIIKPVGGTRGRGIRVVKDMSNDMMAGARGKWICQRYIASPDLIRGRKYDLRLYVAATSADPLRLYIHREGYARLCSEKYDASLEYPDQLYRHVTNSSFQKMHRGYDLSADSTADQPTGNKWHIDAVRREWRRHGKDDKLVWERIEDAITRVFLMFESLGYDETRRYVPHRSNCFCLFGVDVLIDSKMNPWVLELNGLPSTGTDSPLDIRIKSRMLGDMLSLLGLCSRDPDESQKAVEAELMRHKAFRQPQGGRDDAARQHRQRESEVPSEDEIKARLARRGYAASDVDVCVIMEAESEMVRRRGWHRCFPSQRMGRYAPLLEKYRHNTELMLKWETSSML